MPFDFDDVDRDSGHKLQKSLLLLANPIASVLLNPLINLQTMRQIVVPGEMQPSYGELVKSAGPKLLTLGLPALLLRNAVLSLGFIPRIVGN